MRIASIILAALVGAVALAACGSSGTSALSTTSLGPTSPLLPQSVTVSIKIPAQTSSSRRRPAYISAATTKMQVGITPGPGVTSPNPSSTSVPCTGGTCTATVGAYPGSNTFVVNLYDNSNILLSSATQTKTIAAGANTVTLAFGGVPAAITLSGNPPNFTSGTIAQSTVTVTALDADGYTIVGTYASPIPLSTPSPAGYVTLSSYSVASSTQTVTASYNGTTVTACGGVTILATNGFGITGPAGGLGIVLSGGCSSGSSITLSPSSMIAIGVGNIQTVTVTETGFSGNFTISTDTCTGPGYATITPITSSGPTATYNVTGVAPSGPGGCVYIFSDGTNTATLGVNVT